MSDFEECRIGIPQVDVITYSIEPLKMTEDLGGLAKSRDIESEPFVFPAQTSIGNRGKTD